MQVTQSLVQDPYSFTSHLVYAVCLSMNLCVSVFKSFEIYKGQHFILTAEKEHPLIWISIANLPKLQF